MPVARQTEEGRKDNEDHDGARQHGKLLRNDHHVAEHDRVGRGDRREGKIVRLAAPDRARQPLEHEGDADGGQHKTDHIGLRQRPKGKAIRQTAEQEAEADGKHEGHEVIDAKLDVQHPGDEAGEHEEFALGEVDNARRLVDHHEAQGDEGIQRPRRNAAHQQIAKQHHQLFPAICTKTHKPFLHRLFGL